MMNSVTNTMRAKKKTVIASKKVNKMVYIAMIIPPTLEETNHHQS